MNARRGFLPGFVLLFAPVLAHGTKLMSHTVLMRYQRGEDSNHGNKKKIVFRLPISTPASGFDAHGVLRVSNQADEMEVSPKKAVTILEQAQVGTDSIHLLKAFFDLP